VSYQIDQSGKIEHTSKNTYLALANGRTTIIKISSVEKRRLIKSIQQIHPLNRTYIFQIFAVLVFILLKEAKLQQILIGTEYPGKQGSIKEVLVQLFESQQINLPEIDFGFVAKKVMLIWPLLLHSGRKKEWTLQ